MEAKIIFDNGSAIVPSSHVAFRAIKRLAKGQPLNKPFFIKDGVIAEVHAVGDASQIAVQIREGGMIDYEYAILDGEHKLLQAYIDDWTNGR